MVKRTKMAFFTMHVWAHALSRVQDKCLFSQFHAHGRIDIEVTTLDRPNVMVKCRYSVFILETIAFREQERNATEILKIIGKVVLCQLQ